MAIFATPRLSLEESPVPRRTIDYFKRRVRRHVFDILDELFDRVSGEYGLTKAEFADRIEKDRGWLSRTLGTQGNWTLDTITELLVGMGIDPTKLFVPASELFGAEKPGAKVTSYFVPMGADVALRTFAGSATQESAALATIGGGYGSLSRQQPCPVFGSELAAQP